MSTENNISSFTAADIAKYHKGLLSSKEMHAMEKAALDDPFLADAIEGYAVTGVDAGADLADLKKRLATRTKETKVVSMYGEKKKSFLWWRVAAAVLVIGGAGILVNKYMLKENKGAGIARVTPEQNEAASNPDTVIDDNKTTTSPTYKIETVPPVGNTADAGTVTATDKEQDIKGTVTAGNEMEKLVDEVASMEDKTKPGKVTAVPVATEAAIDNELKRDDAAEKKELAKTETKFKDIVSATGGTNNNGVISPTNSRVASAPAKKMTEEGFYRRNQQTAVFRGRITDASNTGLPFAKVSNPSDNDAGTYTDANGYFSLTYPDTALNVQVKALGYQNANVQLQNNLASNRIVMQDDRNLSEFIISAQKPNATDRSRSMNRTFEEPEPADGWEKYDAYLANNLEAPEEIKTTERNVGSVLVSFEVDKNGNPVNFTVEKSLCTKCDKEAIRLIKEGPKWKRPVSRNGRTTVTINF